MSVTLIILILAVGFILVLLEVLVLPGVGVAGIIGALLLAGAVYAGYSLSPVTGHITLGTAFVMSAVLLYLSLRRKTWDRVTLHEEMTGRSGIDNTLHVKAGDTGETITRLNPSGKANINGQVWEVSTRGGDFVGEDMKIEVVKVEVNKIFVKSLTES